MTRRFFIPKHLPWLFFLSIFLQGILFGILLSFQASESELIEAMRSLESFVEK